MDVYEGFEVVNSPRETVACAAKKHGKGFLVTCLKGLRDPAGDFAKEKTLQLIDWAINRLDPDKAA